ncbi:MAG: hypothetical protein IPJ95_12265 [Gemmatimonadetes bacterium]|nr:hypothetical protein [Gemmatimonadota bacterium]MBK6778876.1 hypothetical protein [Gemmatimonadota bacterium]MBK7348814.1 hypothetical protein [Gemmatimonadota bacterium]MBK7783443.1 hypothetical protein [Gemmatimonadota bacterium]MBK7924382.1 hypothetical protein [Gemmatimonadota bacterium]
MRKHLFLLLACAVAGASSLAAQKDAPIVGTWQAELKDQNRQDAPREVIVRADSSASWGKETVRWRLKADSVMIALGGEWVTYKLKVDRTRLTLSGGDLAKPVTLTRVGAPTPRPEGVAVPPDPDTVP